MGDLIDDEILNTFAVVAEPEKVAPELLARYGDVVDRISFYAPYESDPDRWTNVWTRSRRVEANDSPSDGLEVLGEVAGPAQRALELARRGFEGARRDQHDVLGRDADGVALAATTRRVPAGSSALVSATTIRASLPWRRRSRRR